MKKTLLLSVFIPALAVAQEPLDRFKPQEPAPLAKEKKADSETEPTFSPRRGKVKGSTQLRGLIFVGDKSQVRTKGAKRQSGIDAAGVPMLDNPEFAKRMEKFLGQPITIDLVNAIGLEAATYFKEHDRPVVSVVPPRQDVTNGVVQLVVTEAHLGTVHVVGNRWFKTDLFRVNLRPGDEILMSQLDADTSFYERNPFRKVSAELSPGKESGSTDVTLRVEDKFPLRAYAGYDNSGVKDTGENRLFTGFNYGNLFGLGQELSYQFTTDVNFEHLFAHSATYTIPLPWHHILQFSGTYSESRPKLDTGFDLHGTSWEVGGKYIIPLPEIGHYTQELSLGYDFKSTDNNLQFGGEQVFDTPVELSEFSLAYSSALPDRFGRTSLNVTGYWSPGGMSGLNTNEAFEVGRQGAKANYVYADLEIDRVTQLPFGLSWSLALKGQLASGNLQGIDQFLLGGESTVRGYPELIAAGDRGLLIRNEIYSPSFSIGRLLHSDKWKDEFQFLVFQDYGITAVAHPLPQEDRTTALASVGVGARWQVRDNLTFYADYGWQLLDTDLSNGTHSRLSIGATISF